MKEFFSLYPVAAWSLVSTMIALVVVVSLWDKIAWWWQNTMYAMPFFGKISRLSKDTIADNSNPGWYKAERTLCYDYKKFIKIQDEHDFNEKITYLTKAGDNGRRGTPFWIWILTVGMVFVEAMGFSYVLAGYTIPGASENMQQYGAYGIAFLISVLLVAFTHFAGHECFKSSQIKAARREWMEDGRKVAFNSGEVPLARPQGSDDAMPSYTQLSNRVGKSTTFAITIATVVLVLVIGILATFVRGQVLEKQLTEQVTGQIHEAKASAKASNDSMDMSTGGMPLPDADVASNTEADIKAVRDSAGYDRVGGWGTFIVLAFVFLFLQFLGGVFGFRWGFAGKNSAEAYKAIGNGRYATYADVRIHYEEIAGVAQSKLEDLQQKMMMGNGGVGINGVHTTKTFLQFIQEYRQSSSLDRDNENGHTARRNTVQNQVHSQPQPATQPQTPPAYAAKVEPLAPPATGFTPTAPVVSLVNVEQLTVPQILNHLEALGDKESKKAYLATLPPALDDEVRKALKAKKDDAERLKQERDKELEDLL